MQTNSIDEGMLYQLSALIGGSLSHENIKCIVDIIALHLNDKMSAEEALEDIRVLIGERELTEQFAARLLPHRLREERQEMVSPSDSGHNSNPEQSMLTKNRGSRGATGWTPEEDRRLIEAVQKQ
eukprot:gnl/Chilomastix_caulleri/2530.p2 GENE.gnl/Chilomastix_caulleri/2530~~gnl/Chilomastix_caulleri/2530.p2  ORF type:complete len:125 (+),score=16.56 gnl/Chilomastix_caulleri/2530:45-419(+)